MTAPDPTLPTTSPSTPWATPVRCPTPSPAGTGTESDSIQSLLARNFAVVITDYQGSRQACSAGLVSGHNFVDSYELR